MFKFFHSGFLRIFLLEVSFGNFLIARLFSFGSIYLPGTAAVVLWPYKTSSYEFLEFVDSRKIKGIVGSEETLEIVMAQKTFLASAIRFEAVRKFCPFPSFNTTVSAMLLL